MKIPSPFTSIASSKSQDKALICPSLFGESLASSVSGSLILVIPPLLLSITGVRTGESSTLIVTLISESPVDPPIGELVLSTIINNSSPSSSSVTVQVSESESVTDCRSNSGTNNCPTSPATYWSCIVRVCRYTSAAPSSAHAVTTMVVPASSLRSSPDSRVA